MFTLTSIFDNFLFTLPLLLCTLFVGFRLPRRKYFAVRISVGIVILVAIVLVMMVIYYYTEPSGFLRGTKFFVQYIAVIFLMWLCFDCNFWAALFCATVGYCIEHAGERSHEILIFSALRGMNVFLRGLIRIVFITAICIIVYFLLIRKHKRGFNNIMVDNKMQIIAAMLVVAIITFINNKVIYSAINTTFPYAHIITVAFAFVSIIMQYSMSSNKQREAELNILKKIQRDEKDRYEKEKENIELINIKCHDLRHQIAVYENKLEKEEIKSISDAIMFYDSGQKTGNDALDMVLNEKSLICQKHKIKLTCLIDGRRLDFIPAHEIYSLIGNVLENAINAVKELPEEKRIISITDAGKSKLINMAIENYFAGNITFVDGLPITKQSSDYHGFGMKSMKYIAEKYGGALRSYITGDVFRLEIFLPITNATT